ncbi:MAG: hypothetical protein LIO94_11205 [Clostridiales bacterium]|nr:hypothetical protein [Clostridiales bacterium]
MSKTDKQIVSHKPVQNTNEITIWAMVKAGGGTETALCRQEMKYPEEGMENGKN